MNEYDEDFFDEKPAAKKEAAAEEVAQPNPEEGEKKRAFASPKAALCALFALLAAIVLGLGAAFFVVPAIFRTTVSVPFVIIGFAGGGILLALSIVMGFLCKKEAKEKGTEPKLGFVTSFFLSRLLSVFSIIGLFALFVFCLGAAIFNPDNYFSSLAGISSDILISLAMTVSYAAFPLFFLKLAYGALYELYGKGTLSDAGNRKGLTLDGETFAFFLGVWFGFFFLYGFGPYPREWLGLYVLDPATASSYITAEAAGMPVLPAFSYDPVMTLLAMFAIFTFLNFALRLVFFIRATKRNAAHGYVLLAKKRVPAFLMLIIGIAAMIAGFVMLNMAPAYPPEEYVLLGHTYEAVAAVVFWVGAALGVYAIVGVLPFLVLSFFKFMKTQPVIQPKEDPLAKETSRNALKRKKLAEEAEAAAEQGPEKEELDDILQQKLSLDKMKYRTVGSIFGAMLILALVSVGALVAVMAMRFGFGYEDKIYGTFFIALIFASLLFLALTAAFGSLLRHRLANGGKRSKVRFFDHPKLMKFFYGISLLPFGIFMIFFALDVSGEWAFGTETNLIMPSYYAGYFLILFLAILGLAIGYSTARAAVNGKSLAARRGAFGLTWFLAAILVYGAIGMIVAQNLGGAGFGSILPINMGEVYTLIFVSAIFALVFAILEGILHHQANKKGLVRGQYPFFARSLVPIILTIIAGFALLVVGIIMYLAANSSSKQAEGTMGLAMCLLWPGLALTLTAFTCLIPLHASSRKAPPDPIDKDDDEEEAEANVRDEYGFIIEENQEQEAAPEMAADKGNVASSGIQVESPLAFARSLSKFFRANGLALEEKEAVRLSAFLSYSHLLYIKGLRKEEANEFLEVLSAFFESQFSLFEEKVDLATYFQACFDLTKEESAKPCFLAQHALGSRSFSEELKPLLPPLNDLSMPYQIPELEQTSALPSNLYHIVFLEDDDTGLEGVSEAFALASVFHLTLPTCEKEGEATPLPLTDYDFLSISTKASDRFYMGEESWKKIDALSGFVSSMKEFTLMNDARNGVERASAFLLSSMFEEEQVFDEIMASCILPHIILHLDDLELIEGEKGLHVQTGIIFGDSPLRKSEGVFQAYQAELLRRKEGQVAAMKAETFESAPLEEQHREEAPQEAQEEPAPEEAPIEEPIPEEETPMEEAVEEPSEETPAPEQEEAPEEPAPEQEEGGDE